VPGMGLDEQSQQSPYLNPGFWCGNKGYFTCRSEDPHAGEMLGGRTDHMVGNVTQAGFGSFRGPV